MSKLSVIIPARNEEYLARTVSTVLTQAAGDVECYVVLDGYWPNPPLQDDPRLHILHSGTAHGMRAAINSAAVLTRGSYLMKLDAHCLLGEGYDEILKTDCDDNWLVVPRRKRLDAERWEVAATDKPDVDYYYLGCPLKDPKLYPPSEPTWYWRGCVWTARSAERAAILLDDQMTFQGSAWFCSSAHFRNMGGLQEIGYGPIVQEAQELGNKTWLGGGRVAINKRDWYAHWHRPTTERRPYYLNRTEAMESARYSADYWMNNRWPGRTHDMAWLIDKFWPVPGWPEDWQAMDWPNMLVEGNKHG